MSDTYQAIYDAVRSRISGGNISDAVESAMRDACIGDQAQSAVRAIADAASCYTYPSVMYRPALSIDGDQWCALYGDDIQSGVAGFGDSPSLAMSDFDKNWYAKLQLKKEPNEHQN